MKFYIFAFAALLVTANPAVKQNSTPTKADNKGQQGRVPATVTSVNNEAGCCVAETRKQEAPKWYATIEWANWFLALIALGTGIAIWRQANETAAATKVMRDSLPHQKAAAEAAQKAAEVSFLNIEAFKNKERARLTVRPSYKETLNTFEEDSTEAIYFAGQNYPEAGVEISQNGPTMAFNVAGRFTLMSSPDRTPPPMLNPNMARMDIATEIEGNASKPELATLILGGCDTEAVANETLFIHFFGLVTYVDVFDGPHYMRFRYVWIPTRYEWVTDEDGDVKGPDYDRIAEEGHWAQHGPPEDNQSA